MPGLRNDDVVGACHARSADRGNACECWRDFIGGTGVDRKSLVTGVGSSRKMDLANSQRMDRGGRFRGVTRGDGRRLGMPIARRLEMTWKSGK